MTPLGLQHLSGLDELLTSGTTYLAAFPQAIGGTSACHGIWRFFSDSWPQGGISSWNGGSSWRAHWLPFLPSGFFSFGEDVFGNQLVVVNGGGAAVLWNHETGECHDLLVGPSELLRTAFESGIDWIDIYSDDSLAIAKQFGPVPLASHLHWMKPLFLGGQTTPDNVSLVKREAHLIGHAKLWSQVGELPPGTSVIPG